MLYVFFQSSAIAYTALNASPCGKIISKQDSEIVRVQIKFYITGYISGYNKQLKLLDKSEMHGQWNDILVNAKWTHKKDGFFKIWINGKLAFHHKGRTQEKGERIEFHVGVYRSYIQRAPVCT